MATSKDATAAAPSPAPKQETRAQIENRKTAALLQWLESNGVYISDKSSWGVPGHSLVVANETMDDYEPSGRGLLARREITQGQPLFSIPEELVMTKEKAKKTLGSGLVTDDMDEFIALALLLIVERGKGDTSFWKPYLDIIPQDEELNPLFRWKDEEKALLKGSPALVAAESLKQKLKDEFAYVSANIIAKNPEVFNNLPEYKASKAKSKIDFELWEWAFAVLFSRAICFPSTNDLALVPYADLLNHNSFCSTFFDVQTDGFFNKQRNVVLYTDRNYKQTEQVYVTYGQKSNAELLLLYGFVVERNPFDSVDICVSLNEKDPTYKKKLQILQDSGTEVAPRFPLFQDRYPKELIEFLRFCVATEKELDADFGEYISAENEQAVANAIIEACEDALVQYPNTMEEDEALLKDRNLYSLLSQNMKWAIKHRRSEKRILKRTIQNIKREQTRPSYMFTGSASGVDKAAAAAAKAKNSQKASMNSIEKILGRKPTAKK